MKNLSFNEKSAWAMIVALLGAGGLYTGSVLSAFFTAGGILPPGRLAILFVVLLVLISIVTHIAVAISAPSEAEETRDERDKTALHFAGNWSGIALGIGTITSLLAYLVVRDGDLLFHCMFLSLIVASLVDYVMRLIAYRWVV